jgi:hypothetical protein
VQAAEEVAIAPSSWGKMPINCGSGLERWLCSSSPLLVSAVIYFKHAALVVRCMFLLQGMSSDRSLTCTMVSFNGLSHSIHIDFATSSDVLFSLLAPYISS